MTLKGRAGHTSSLAWNDYKWASLTWFWNNWLFKIWGYTLVGYWANRSLHEEINSQRLSPRGLLMTNGCSDRLFLTLFTETSECLWVIQFLHTWALTLNPLTGPVNQKKGKRLNNRIGSQSRGNKHIGFYFVLFVFAFAFAFNMYFQLSMTLTITCSDPTNYRPKMLGKTVRVYLTRGSFFPCQNPLCNLAEWLFP